MFQPGNRRIGYLATVLGSVLGGTIAALIGWYLSATNANAIANLLNTIMAALNFQSTAFRYLVNPNPIGVGVVGGAWVGEGVGCFLALRLGGYSKAVLTAVILAIVVIPIVLMGLLIGKNFVNLAFPAVLLSSILAPLLARYRAVL